MHPRRPPKLSGTAIGHTLRFLKDPFSLINEGVQQHGDIFSVRFLGFGEWTFLGSPEAVKAMFKAPVGVLAAGEANKAQLGFMLGTDSSFSLDGDAHRQRQRLVHPLLNSKAKIHRHIPTIERLTRRMAARWPRGKAFPFLHQGHRLSLDVMIHTLLAGSPAEELDSLGDLFDRFASQGLRSPLIAMPYLQWNLGRFSPWGRILHLRRQVMESFREQMRRRHEAAASDAPDALNDPSSDDPSGQLAAATQKDGQRLSETALLEELINLLFAGHETTGTILTWALECLLSHPEVMERLRHEIDQVVGTESITAEHLQRLPYLDAVIQETIRYRPLAPMAGVRLVKQPFAIGNYEIPTGHLVVQCFPAMAKRPELFARPDQFDPQHFFERKMRPFTWNPFGGGTRMCIGRGLAELELQVVLVSLLQNLEFELAQPDVRAVRNGFFFAPNRGLQITIRERP